MGEINHIREGFEVMASLVVPCLVVGVWGGDPDMGSLLNAESERCVYDM